MRGYLAPKPRGCRCLRDDDGLVHTPSVHVLEVVLDMEDVEDLGEGFLRDAAVEALYNSLERLEKEDGAAP